MQTPHKLWPSQELRAIRDCLRTVLASESDPTEDSQADTYDVPALIAQIADCEKLFLRKSGAIRQSVADVEREIADQRLAVERLESKANWERHRCQTAAQQAEVATAIADAYIEKTTARAGRAQAEVPDAEASSLNAKIQHIIDQNAFNERFKNESVNSLTLPLAQLDSALEQATKLNDSLARREYLLRGTMQQQEKQVLAALHRERGSDRPRNPTDRRR